MAPLPERVLFLTGRLAETVVRRVVDDLSRRSGLNAEVRVLPISVAALMHTDWIARKLSPISDFSRVIVPGWCQGNLEVLSERYGAPFEAGPKDIHQLPEFLGSIRLDPPDLSKSDIEIIAEINHAPRMSEGEIRRMAADYAASGADVIDVGCIPGESWPGIANTVRCLVADGLRVSIDSFDRVEVESAVDAGAELVLSCNRGNLEWAAELDVEWVVIPEQPADIDSLQETIDVLQSRGRRFRIDPILDPIGCGFAASLARYFEVRRRWPDAEVMMGVGNLTEMTEVDSAGVNVVLAAICQELGIRSILTTEVINWARSAVREFDIARRLVRYAHDHRQPPKHVSSQLVMLRDSRVGDYSPDELDALAAQLRDPNFRIFVESGKIHVMNRAGYWRGRDAFELFDRFAAANSELDASHAFYLGYELAKAVTALTLGKQYKQDESLNWGMLTIPEESAHERRRRTESLPGTARESEQA